MKFMRLQDKTLNFYSKLSIDTCKQKLLHELNPQLHGVKYLDRFTNKPKISLTYISNKEYDFDILWNIGINRIEILGGLRQEIEGTLVHGKASISLWIKLYYCGFMLVGIFLIFLAFPEMNLLCLGAGVFVLGVSITIYIHNTTRLIEILLTEIEAKL